MSAPSTNQFSAQQDSNLTTPDNVSSSSSSTSFDNKSSVFVVNSESSIPEVGAGVKEETCASSDIFGQIGNLVKCNQRHINKQLSNGLSGIENEHKSPIRPEKIMDTSAFVSAFPLLDFMRSPVLMFSMKPDNVGINSGCYINSFTKGDASLSQTKGTHDSTSNCYSGTG